MRTYRASGMGYSMESLVAGHLGYEKVDAPEFLQRAYAEGNRIEPLAVQKLWDAGWTVQERQEDINMVGDYQIEVELEVIPGVAKVVGHLDGVGGPEGGPVGVVEIKSMNGKAWKSFRKHGWDSPGLIQKYKWQQSAYSLAAGLPHWMVAWNKDTEELWIEFTKEPFYMVADMALRLQEAEEWIGKGMVPDGCTDYPCGYFYLHAGKDEVVVDADEELEKVLALWLIADQSEKTFKGEKEQLRAQILAMVANEEAGKVRGRSGVSVETYYQEEKEVVSVRKGGWVTRVQGPRKKKVEDANNNVG